MRRFYIILTIMIAFTLSLSYGWAEEVVSEEAIPEETEAQEEEVKQPEQKELTKEQIVERLNNVFKNRPNIASLIQGLGAQESESGVSFTYNGVLLESLDKDTLMGILRNVNQHISLQNYQQMQRQMRQMKQIQDMNRQQRQLRQLRRKPQY